MAGTKYTMTTSSGFEATYARKEAAIKAGEKQGGDFTVRTGSGNVVHEYLGSEPAEQVDAVEADLDVALPGDEPEAEEVAPEPAEEEAPDAWSAAEPTPTDDARDHGDEPEPEPAFEASVAYRDHGPKHFWKALGRSAVEVFETDEHVSVTFNNRDFTVHFRSDDQMIADAMAERVGVIWDDAMEALKGFKKTDAYRAADKKTSEGKAEAYRLEQEFLSNFVADALDDTDEVL